MFDWLMVVIMMMMVMMMVMMTVGWWLVSGDWWLVIEWLLLLTTTTTRMRMMTDDWWRMTDDWWLTTDDWWLIMGDDDDDDDDDVFLIQLHWLFTRRRRWRKPCSHADLWHFAWMTSKLGQIHRATTLKALSAPFQALVDKDGIMSQKNRINYDHSLVSICYHCSCQSYADCIPPVSGIGLAISTEPQSIGNWKHASTIDKAKSPWIPPESSSRTAKHRID